MRGAQTSNELIYQAEFQPPARDPSCSRPEEAFATVRIPFSCFRLVKRSVPVPAAPPLPINSIYQVGLVMSKFSFGEDEFNPSFQPGLFRLEIAEIGAYRDPAQHAAFVDTRAAASGEGLAMPQQDMIQDTLRFKPTGQKRSWFSRLFLGRLRSALRRRVADKRTKVAQELLAARKEGKRLSEWRKESQ
mmetsp:Transcript_23983/g.48155  ORF Transcript_23983/g.48155 Transcript_23983/m.48155 type:complete len:189 (+) Transcript_23983:1-567(+)